MPDMFEANDWVEALTLDNVDKPLRRLSAFAFVRHRSRSNGRYVWIALLERRITVSSRGRRIVGKKGNYLLAKHQRYWDPARDFEYSGLSVITEGKLAKEYENDCVTPRVNIVIHG